MSKPPKAKLHMPLPPETAAPYPHADQPAHAITDQQTNVFIEQHASTSASWRGAPLSQAPTYPSQEALRAVEQKLEKGEGVVLEAEVNALRHQLAQLVRNQGFILQIGDCAESFVDSCEDYTLKQLSLFQELHRQLDSANNGNVLIMGRMAGQFAKSRTQLTECINGKCVPSFFGDVVNGFDSEARTPDPQRMLIGYYIARDVAKHAREHTYTWAHFAKAQQNWAVSNATPFDKKPSFCFGETLFTCHEAYLLPYEASLTRPASRQTFVFSGDFSALTETQVNQEYPNASSHAPSQQHNRTIDAAVSVEPYTIYHAHQDFAHTPVSIQIAHDTFSIDLPHWLTNSEDAMPEGTLFSTSAHFLWVGERTRNINHGHIAFIEKLGNPIGVKIGPNMDPDELITLIQRLNPDNKPGRLSFIVRIGVLKITDVLEKYLHAISNAGLLQHVLWICDPMHGNTIYTADNIKTRRVEDIIEEIRLFYHLLTAYRIRPSGVHLEATPHAIMECSQNTQPQGPLTSAYRIPNDIREDGVPYKMECDPRLNTDQTLYVLQHIIGFMNNYVLSEQ